MNIYLPLKRLLRMSVTYTATRKFVQPAEPSFPQNIPGLTTDRITHLRKKCHNKNILYLMRRDQRLHQNYAVMLGYQLSYNTKSQLYIGVEFDKLTLNNRQKKFFAEGLMDVEDECKKYNLSLFSISSLSEFAKEHDVDCIILDYSPLRQCRLYYKTVEKICDMLDMALYQVDAHNIVPARYLNVKRVRTADVKSDLKKFYHKCLVAFPKLVRHEFNHSQLNPNNTFAFPDIDNSFKGGYKAGMRAVEEFYSRRMKVYAEKRNDVDAHAISDLSPWVHAGHVSVQHILHLGLERFGPLDKNYTKFVDEIHAWKSVGEHFVKSEEFYDSIDGAQEWAKETMEAHRHDKREKIYTLEQLAGAQTSDKHWNAGQNEMLVTGKMHGYVRIYWAKKLLQWSETPREAVERAVYLNDTYSIDGNDPNGYLGIMWSMCGVMESNPQKLKADWPVSGRILPMKPYRAERYVARWCGII